jgi:putative addiction module component (TIGR02574 family)
VTRERIPCVDVALVMIAIAIAPTCVVAAISPVLIRAFPIAARTTTERPAIVAIAVARSNLRLAPVVISAAIVRAAAASRIRGTSMPLVVVRVEVARVEIHRRATLSVMDPRQLLAEALRLSDGERAALAGELIQSLDSEVDPDAEAAWSAEIRARLDRVDAGTARTISWAEARRRIHAAAGRAPRT